SLDKNQQFDLCRPSESDHRIERCADCSAGKQHVVHQHHLLPFNQKRNPCFVRRYRCFAATEIVTVEGRVEVSKRNVRFDVPLKLLMKDFGKIYTSWLKTDYNRIGKIVVILN